MNKKQREIIGILLMALGVLILLSLISYNPHEEPTISSNVVIQNWMGLAGVFISFYLFKFTLGIISFIIPLLIILWGVWLFFDRDKRVLLRFTIYLLLMGITVATTLALPAVKQKFLDAIGFRYSGFLGGVIAKTLTDFLGLTGSIILLVAIALVLVRGYFSWSFLGPFDKLASGTDFLARFRRKSDNAPVKEKRARKMEEAAAEKPKTVTPKIIDKPAKDAKKDIISEKPEPPVREKIVPKFTVDTEIIEKNATEKDTKPAKKMPFDYKLPDVNFLDPLPDQQDGVTEEEMTENARLLEESLATFRVEGYVRHVSPGPVVTRYEVEPGKGVRISKIAALADDLARILKAKRIRIVAPIPGKSVVGIEIPNKKQAIIYFRSVVGSQAYKNSDSKLKLALGKTISGEIFVADLAKMPHLLIAGATGAGKSVCLNTIITSILYNSGPDEVKFAMVDPKKLELSVYKSLVGYHLIHCEDLDEYVVTRPDNAIILLKSMEKEMERRYDILAGATVRNIAEYNDKIATGKLDKEKMPYIVVVIDELADLMLTSAREVEEPITRLAQMARAVGIHLIIATQRPSVNVITGVIKANFPARIAFQVASKIDSRTILDINGAEKLLGRGDMLLTTPQHPEPTRVHGAYLSLSELENVLQHITTQPKPEEIELPSVREEETEDFGFLNDGERDELYDEAMKLVVMHQQGSISLLQRRLKIGYSRAARLIDQLEQGGIVGPFTGSKAREVLVEEDFLEHLNVEDDDDE